MTREKAAEPPAFYDGANVITRDGVDRLTDRAYEFGWKAALSALEMRVAVRGNDPIGVGQKNERERVLMLITELRSRYGADGEDRYGA